MSAWDWRTVCGSAPPNSLGQMPHRLNGFAAFWRTCPLGSRRPRRRAKFCRPREARTPEYEEGSPAAERSRDLCRGVGLCRGGHYHRGTGVSAGTNVSVGTGVEFTFFIRYSFGLHSDAGWYPARSRSLAAVYARPRHATADRGEFHTVLACACVRAEATGLEPGYRGVYGCGICRRGGRCTRQRRILWFTQDRAVNLRDA